MNYIYIMEYYSAKEKKEIMLLIATWLQLEIIMLYEVSQKGKEKYHIISLMCDTHRKAMPKNIQITTRLYSSHTLAKQCLKFSKPGFNNTWIVNFQMFKMDLEKAEEQEVKLSISVESSKKQESSRKTSFCFSDYAKAFDLWIITKCRKFFKRWE